VERLVPYSDTRRRIVSALLKVASRLPLSCRHILLVLEYSRWKVNRAGTSIPRLEKVRLILQSAAIVNADTFVETGTYLGDTIAAVKGTFRELYSIELDERLYRGAAFRFARSPNVHLVHGDSAVEIKVISSRVRRPAVFWLDAHFSGAESARGPVETPILAEVETILGTRPFREAIMIDDADHFDGRNGYPTREVLESLVQSMRPGTVVRLESNVLRILPTVVMATTN
jgi:hypothetical protein